MITQLRSQPIERSASSAAPQKFRPCGGHTGQEKKRDAAAERADRGGETPSSQAAALVRLLLKLKRLDLVLCIRRPVSSMPVVQPSGEAGQKHRGSLSHRASCCEVEDGADGASRTQSPVPGGPR